MKRLLIFPFNRRNKTETLLSECLGGGPGETLYIAPHMSKVKDFKMRYHRMGKGSALLPATHTIKTLALKILDNHCEERIISEVEKYVAILGILKRRKTDESSHALPGMALAVSHFIKDFKISSAGPISLEKARKEMKDYGWKFEHNISLLLFAVDVMEEYCGFLKKGKLLDMEDIYNRAAQHAGELKYRQVLFDGFCEIPPYQRGFIESMLEQAPEATFSFCHDEKVSIDVRELVLEKALSWLKGLCPWEEKRFETEERTVNTECYNFASQPEEVAGMAGIIANHIAAGNGRSLNDVMAVFPSMPSYRPVVERIFRRYNLPCEIIPGYSLSQDSSVTTLLELFAFHTSYDWETLMNIFTSPHLTEIDLREAERFSIHSRKYYARTGFLRENFYGLRGSNFRVVKSMLEKIGGKDKSLKKWAEAMEELVELSGWTPGLPEVRVRFRNVMEEIKNAAVFSQDEFVNILNRIFGLVEVEEGRGRGVKVSGIQESVGLEKKLCVIGGATEGNIPGAPSIEEVFMPDGLKKQMGLTDCGLRVARERLDLYRLKNENEKVVFTYPSKMHGENQMKSIFLFGEKESVTGNEVFVSRPREIFKMEFSAEKFRKNFVVDGRLRMSVTQFELFKRCAYRFYLQNVEKTEPYCVPEINETPDIWGTVVHEVMRNIFQDYKRRVITERETVELKRAFREGVHAGIRNLHDKGSISTFYGKVLSLRSEEVYGRFDSIITAHHGCEFVDAECPMEVQLPHIHIRGTIDRIERTAEGGINIVDIKTGTSAPPSYTENDFNNGNMQIPLYMWMYGRISGIGREKLTGNIWRFDFTEDTDGKNEKFYPGKKLNYLDGVEDVLEETAVTLLEKEINFSAEQAGACYGCPYGGMCPYEGG